MRLSEAEEKEAPHCGKSQFLSSAQFVQKGSQSQPQTEEWATRTQRESRPAFPNRRSTPSSSSSFQSSRARSSCPHAALTASLDDGVVLLGTGLRCSRPCRAPGSKPQRAARRAPAPRSGTPNPLQFSRGCVLPDSSTLSDAEHAKLFLAYLQFVSYVLA